jgi:cytochrome c-type biogenesis protein CcmH
LNGETAARHSALGEALVAAAGGVVTQEAKAAIERAAALDAEDVTAGYYLGVAAEQDGRPADAAARWRAMLAGAPAGAPYGDYLRSEIARVEGAGGRAGEDGLAAAELAPEQRSAMIRGMVDRLAERLKRDGSDLDGWLRLVRSYMVLGERDKAQAAAADARRALAAEPDKLRRIEEAVKGFGLDG